MRSSVKIKSFLLFALFFMIGAWAQCQTEAAEKRIALVVGNSDYLVGPLQNPVNDARSIARALRNNGFEVIRAENVSNKAEMKKVIRDFGWKLREGGVGLFYYAGHGIQVDGFNFLVPVNAEINNEEEVEYECIDAGFVLAQMEAAQNRLNIVILDACRNNPFARSFRSTKQGLAGMNASTGTLIAYSTAPGSVASDGSGFNGLYTEALLNQIDKPDLKIEEVFKNVRAEVLQKSEGRQTPWESSSLVGDFYFKPVNVASTYNSELQNQPVYEPPSPPAETVLKTQWRGTKDGTYWLYVNGELATNDFEQVDFDKKNDRVHFIHKPTGRSYAINNFRKNLNNELHEGLDIGVSQNKQYDPEISTPKNNTSFTGNNPLDQIRPLNTPKRYKPEGLRRPIFRVTNAYAYTLTYNGREISEECVHKLYNDEDLYVYHPPTGLMFLLEGFSWANDNRPRTGNFVRFKEE